MPDWKGDAHAVAALLAASNHSDVERAERDYYATPPAAVEALIKREKFCKYIFEPAVGGGHIAEVFKSHGHKVQAMDIVDRGYPGTVVKDFFTTTKADLICSPDIVTNPPYMYACEFAEHALAISMDSVKIAMLVKIQFLETKKRYDLFKIHPPKVVYVFVDHIACAKNGKFTDDGSAVCYCWVVWEKGSKTEPVIRWISDDDSKPKRLF